MSTSGIQYVYCAAGPTPSNCPTSGSDQAFSGADITNMNTAFTNWTNAKTANNSNLPFTNLSAISGSTTFTIQVNRLDPIAMLGVSGQVTTRGWNPVDYNNDGIADETRLYDAIIDINGSYHAADLTGILAHEIGHVMGLDDCASCNSTTVMTYAFPGPSGPSTCDNDRVHTVFP